MGLHVWNLMFGIVTFIFLPIFFSVLKMSAFYACCIYSNEIQNTLTIEANNTNPDQTAPMGAV